MSHRRLVPSGTCHLVARQVKPDMAPFINAFPMGRALAVACSHGVYVPGRPLCFASAPKAHNYRPGAAGRGSQSTSELPGLQHEPGNQMNRLLWVRRAGHLLEFAAPIRAQRPSSRRLPRFIDSASPHRSPDGDALSSFRASELLDFSTGMNSRAPGSLAHVRYAAIMSVLLST